MNPILQPIAAVQEGQLHLKCNASWPRRKSLVGSCEVGAQDLVPIPGWHKGLRVSGKIERVLLKGKEIYFSNSCELQIAMGHWLWRHGPQCNGGPETDPPLNFQCERRPASFTRAEQGYRWFVLRPLRGLPAYNARYAQEHSSEKQDRCRLRYVAESLRCRHVHSRARRQRKGNRLVKGEGWMEGRD